MRTPIAVRICLEVALLAVCLLGGVAPGGGQELEAVVGRAPLEGQRVVLVTGSTGGLGREVARKLAAGGDHVIVHGRDVERGSALVTEIEGQGKGERPTLRRGSRILR